MSIDAKNDLDIRCDAVQKVATAIAKLRTEDAEKVVAFATALKNGQQISIANDLQVMRSLFRLEETFDFIERMQAMMECLLKYFSIGKEAMTNEHKQRIIAEYDQNRVMFDIAFDYMLHINHNCNGIRDNLNSLELTTEQERTE